MDHHYLINPLNILYDNIWLFFYGDECWWQGPPMNFCLGPQETLEPPLAAKCCFLYLYICSPRSSSSFSRRRRLLPPAGIQSYCISWCHFLAQMKAMWGDAAASLCQLGVSQPLLMNTTQRKILCSCLATILVNILRTLDCTRLCLIQPPQDHHIGKWV